MYKHAQEKHKYSFTYVAKKSYLTHTLIHNFGSQVCAPARRAELVTTFKTGKCLSL